MRMVTESVHLSRRAWCQGLGHGALAVLAGGAWVNTAAATRSGTKPAAQKPSAQPALFAACWADAQGAHHAGWLQVADAGGSVSVLRSTELPTRGHGLALLPDGSLLVVARRPGDWLLKLAAGKKPQWLWQEPDRVFSGHVHVAADGRTIYTTEIDTDSGQGFLGVRDANNLDKRAEYATNGRDPHAVLALPALFFEAKADRTSGRLGHFPAGMLFVANGGIDTRIETGRVKRHLQQMDSSIVGLHPATGELLGQWRLPDNRLSLRHLAWAVPDDANPISGGPTLGIALQAEHDDPVQKAAAPLLAVLDWAHQPEGGLRLAQGQPALAGYGGDITLAGRGRTAQWLVSATRGHQVARFGLDGDFVGSHPLLEAGALAKDSAMAWAGGRDALMRVPQAALAPSALPLLGFGKINNHWLRV